MISLSSISKNRKPVFTTHYRFWSNRRKKMVSYLNYCDKDFYPEKSWHLTVKLFLFPFEFSEGKAWKLCFFTLISTYSPIWSISHILFCLQTTDSSTLSRNSFALLLRNCPIKGKKWTLECTSENVSNETFVCASLWLQFQSC